MAAVNKVREELAQAFLAALKEEQLPWRARWGQGRQEDFSGLFAGNDQTVNRPDSRGTSTMPTMATPAPAMSCFMPWLFAYVR